MVMLFAEMSPEDDCGNPWKTRDLKKKLINVWRSLMIGVSDFLRQYEEGWGTQECHI